MDPKNTSSPSTSSAESDAIAMDRIRIIESENMGPITEESIARSAVPPRTAVAPRPVAQTTPASSTVAPRAPAATPVAAPVSPAPPAPPVTPPVEPNPSQTAPPQVIAKPAPVAKAAVTMPEKPARKLTIAERIAEETKKPGPVSKFRPFTRSSTKANNIIAVIIILGLIIGGLVVAWRVFAPDFSLL